MEVASIRIPEASRFKKFLAFSGPGLMIAVGYMDPGNWATDLAAGSKYGYKLLSVIFLSNLIAILLQHLSLRLGIATGRDLAQSCRDQYSRPVNLTLWFLCEIAIAACDLAEIIGSAVALKLLFGLPLEVGVLITALDVLIILYLQNKGFRVLEVLVGTIVFLIGGCFAYELFLSLPDWGGVAQGLLPRAEIVFQPDQLYLAVGILGATVMPHNLYLHSSIVQTRNFPRTSAGKKMAVRYSSLDSALALLVAFAINASILILAASAFHTRGLNEVAELGEAYQLLTPVLAAPLASVVFAIALLASGHNSTLTGTLAGQIVMEGFLDIRLRPWVRRLLTRLVALVPAVVVAFLYGDSAVNDLLILSQVILSLQLSFAVIPLVQFTSKKSLMGPLVIGPTLKSLSIFCAVIIVILNLYLVYGTVFKG